MPSFARNRPWATGLAAAAVVLAVLLGVMLSHLERFFVFFPTTPIVTDPSQMGVQYQDVWFKTSDGHQLHGWYVPAASSSDATLLWFHGNGGNISHRSEEIAQMHRRLAANLFIFDYRGYGKSQGKPSERGTYRDSRAALAYLQSRPEVAPDRIVYFGRSLGAAVAVELAVEHRPMGLVLVAPFASLRDMARIHYSGLPLAALLAGDRYDSLSRLSRVKAPLLVVHGAEDEIVPLSQGKKLYQAASPPKQFQELPEAGHDDTYSAGGSTYWDALSGFLASLTH